MKGVKKHNLPEKNCATCGRPFVRRKKWERVWDEVKYCSDRCRMKKPGAGIQQRREDIERRSESGNS